jgi:hypothetical protein
VIVTIRIYDLHLEPTPQEPAPEAPLTQYCVKDTVGSELWRKVHLSHSVHYDSKSFASLALVINFTIVFCPSQSEQAPEVAAVAIERSK